MADSIKPIKILYANDNKESEEQLEIEFTPLIIESVDERLFEIETELNGLIEEVDDLTNHASKLDYAVAVASGFLTALIDIFFVGKFDLKEGKQWSDEKVEDFVKSVAKKCGYKGDDTKGAIRFLEKYKSPSDNLKDIFGGGKQHHLKDFSHHASLIGLVFSMLTQFTGKAYGTNKLGAFIVVDIENKELIGKEFPQKVSLGLIHWMLHLVSDMSGSSGNLGKGTGIPGPMLSLIKLLGTLPFFKNEKGVHQVSLFASKLFNGTLLSERDANGKIISANPMDLRGELGVLHQLGKQSIPVIVNESLIRGFYSVSRLVEELKCKSTIHDVDWKKVAPYKNATLTRMLTISTGVFSALDQLDAVIEGAINSKANWIEFAKQVVMRVNFAGMARFTVSLGSETILYYKRTKKTKEEIMLLHEALYLRSAKMYYGEKLVWEAAKNTELSVSEFYKNINMISENLYLDLKLTKESIDSIKQINMDAIENKNPGLIDEILKTLK